MSEQINRILADRAQNFTTAEQAQARDNIGAMAASASSLYYSTSNPSGFISAVNHDSNLSGSGTVGVPLGLNSSIVFTSSNRQNTVQSDKMELTAKVNPLVFSGTYRPWGWDISGSATSTTGVTNPKTAIVQSTSYFSMYNTSDDNEMAQSYMTFRGCGFGSSGTAGIAGDELHTNISTLGITSISGYMGTASSHTGFYLNNGADPDRPLELKFESGASTAKVDIDSINRWNSYSANQDGWHESANSLSTGFGGNQATAASQFNDGAGNWTCRRVKCQGVPDQNLYGFQSKPNGTGTAYMVNPAGAFIQYQSNYFCYIATATSAPMDTSWLPTGVTGMAKAEFVNASNGDINIKTDTFNGNTAEIQQGSVQVAYYHPGLDRWIDLNTL